ncbi:hypothetical protein BXZ70DRAFT_787949 [Cristinia sonorae]|uniref:Uncharacterized protein n=1 Tax=Cristinia sonorae TaxID=1940300 RepID=A0A8K0XRQ0_9AGAR|nr:hypothetical protein BXZ70DRAFT_787949 [Cristinia sonorae]
MALPRSKSAPHVPGNNPFSTLAGASAGQPRIPRHASTLGVSSLSFSSAYETSNRSGTQTPRAQRKEDPFSLAGFFPASLSGVYERQEQAEWDWLNYEYEVEESELVGASRAGTSGVVSPSSEDEEWGLPSTPPGAKSPMFDRSADEVCGETIRREDKLGILSLSNPFSVAGTSVPRVPVLLSRYSEDNVLDGDGLYDALCALRAAHVGEKGREEGDGRGGLFSAVEEGVVDGELETAGTRGLGRLLEMLPL